MTTLFHAFMAMVFSLTSPGTSYFSKYALSSSDSGTYSNSAGAGWVDTTNLSITLVTNGRPVIIALVPGDNNSGGGCALYNNNTNGPVSGRFVRGSTTIPSGGVAGDIYAAGNSTSLRWPCTMWSSADVSPGTGSQTFKFQTNTYGTGAISVIEARLFAYTLP